MKATHNSSRSIYSIPLFIGILGVAASVSAFMLFHSLHSKHVAERQENTAQAYINSIKQTMLFDTSSLNTLHAFYEGSEHVDRNEFSIFAKRILKKHPDITALEWVPKVRPSEQKAYIRNAKKDGLSTFSFVDSEGKALTSTSHGSSAYFPTYYIEPIESNEQALGFDLASDVKRFAALERSARENRPIATSPITLVQDSKNNKSVLVFKPIYIDETSPHNIEHVEGFFVIALQISDLIESSLIHLPSNMHVHVTDITDRNQPEIVFNSQNNSAPLHHAVHYSKTLDFAGRKWQLTTRSLEGKSNLGSLLPWLILVGGISFSLLITFQLVQFARRRAIVESIVESRTEELDELNKFQKLILESNPDLIFVKDEQFRIVQANQAFLNVYPEEKRDHVIGYTTLEEYPEEEVAEFLEMDKKAFKEGLSETIETITFPSGHVRILFTKKIRFENSQGEPFILGSSRDVTEREALLESLLNSNEELERFAFVCAHDLQEPLRMIRSFSEKLQLHIGDQLKNDEKGQRYFDFLTDGAIRAQELITDVLAYSSLSKDTRKPEPVNVYELLGTIKDNLNVYLEESGGTITHTNLPTLTGNKTQLYQLFFNIINNGLKYQKPDTTPKVTITATEENTHWKFAISDNGIGIKEHYLNRIFEVFKRLHGRKDYSGTGVGLSICKKVVEHHGGKIWAESEFGKGTTFYFTIKKYDHKETDQ